jgi:hypothetical protein
MKNKIFYFLFFSFLFLLSVSSVLACDSNYINHVSGSWNGYVCIDSDTYFLNNTSCSYQIYQTHNATTSCVADGDGSAFLLNTNGSFSFPVGFMSTFSLDYGGTNSILMSKYFNRYDRISVLIFENGISYPPLVIDRNLPDFQFCLSYDNQYCLYPLTNDFRLDIKSLTKNTVIKNYTVFVRAYNSTSYGFYTQYYSNQNFTFFVNPYSVDSGINAGDKIDASNSNSFLAQWASSFKSLFPDSNELSVSTRLTIVFILLVFISMVVYIFSFLMVRTIYPVTHWSVFLLDCLLVFFFISINYIPLVFLIIIAAIAITATYFRVKSGFSGGGSG